MNLDIARAQPIHQGSIAGQGSGSTPASCFYFGKQIQQALLRSSKLAELLQKQNVHSRSATASTNRYTGNTRQYVSYRDFQQKRIPQVFSNYCSPIRARIRQMQRIKYTP